MDLKVTNRDLLRRYKDLKGKLLNGEVEEIIVPQGGGVVLHISLEKKKSNFERLVGMVERTPLKMLKRPKEDIF